MTLNRKYTSPKRQHPELHKLFSKFADLLEDYDTPPDDTGYWYGERALTGFLAAAVWMLPDGWSLEEFTGLRLTKGKKGSGRGDLWIGLGNKVFTIEAKHLWPGSTVQKAITGARKKLGEADSQLRGLHKTYRVGRPLSVCFMIPELNVKGHFADKPAIKRFFKEVPKALADKKTAVASFWYERQVPKYDGRVYPGVIVVARALPGWS